MLKAGHVIAIQQAGGSRAPCRPSYSMSPQWMARQLRSGPGGVLPRSGALLSKTGRACGDRSTPAATQCSGANQNRLVCRSGAQRPVLLSTATAPAAEGASTANGCAVDGLDAIVAMCRNESRVSRLHLVDTCCFREQTLQGLHATAHTPSAATFLAPSDSLLLYNTMTRKKEVFQPRPGQARENGGTQTQSFSSRPRETRPQLTERLSEHTSRRPPGEQGRHVRVRSHRLRLQPHWCVRRSRDRLRSEPLWQVG